MTSAFRQQVIEALDFRNRFSECPFLLAGHLDTSSVVVCQQILLLLLSIVQQYDFSIFSKMSKFSCEVSNIFHV